MRDTDNKNPAIPDTDARSGDTNQTELDKIEITTAGIGMAEKVINNAGAQVGDVVIASGDLGEHTVALLSERFGYRSRVSSDCKPIDKEIC